MSVILLLLLSQNEANSSTSHQAESGDSLSLKGFVVAQSVAPSTDSSVQQSKPPVKVGTVLIQLELVLGVHGGPIKTSPFLVLARDAFVTTNRRAISLHLCFYSLMCTILFLFVYYSVLFTSCRYFVYCIFVYFVYSSIQPLTAILQ